MIAIVIAPYGWVYVGDFEVGLDEITSDAARVIQRWGTTKGLGELQNEGPKKDTILQDAAPVRIPRLPSVIRPSNPAKWAKHLQPPEWVKVRGKPAEDGSGDGDGYGSGGQS